MTKQSTSRKAVFIYLLFTLIFSAVVWWLQLHAGSGRIGGRMYGYGIMWCPALATLVTLKIMGHRMGDLAWKWGENKYITWSYFVPLLYSLVAYLLIWFAGWGKFYDHKFVSDAAASLGWTKLPDSIFIPLFFIANGAIGIIGSMSTALGEEIGWRGFLVPELYNATKHNFTTTALISGIIWSVWHYPILIFGDYNNGAPAWYGVTCFTVMVVSISFVFAWFRLKSGSLWTGVMLHASHNLFIQSFFTPITVANGKIKYFIDEFGLAVPAICVIVAIYFWTRRKELKSVKVIAPVSGQ